MKFFVEKSRNAVQIFALTAAALSTTDAFAQFTVLEQRATLQALATSRISNGAVVGPDALPQTESQYAGIAPSEVTSQNLAVQATVSNDFLVSAHATLRTTATSSVVGLSDDISLSFEQQAASLSENLYVFGGVAVKASLTFRVDAPMDVSIAALRPSNPVVTPASLYSNWAVFAIDRGQITGAIDNSPFPAHLLTDVQSSSGIAHLSAGNYVIEINTEFVPESGSNEPTVFLSPNGITFGPSTFRTPMSLSLATSAITITAIPEPSTLALGILGLVAGAVLSQRRRA